MMTQAQLVQTSLETAAINQENPWPGLEAYREGDKEFFHGRRQESDELLRCVMRGQLTVLFGQSGLGKTSLLQAGLFPLLRQQEAFPIYIRLDFSSEHLKLADQVKQAIRQETSAMGVEAPPWKDGETLWEYFHRQEADFWNERNKIVVPVLVFDQFEEIFTLGRVDAERKKASEAFLVELGDLIEGRPPAALKASLDESPKDTSGFSFTQHNYKILLSLRKDFLPELEMLKKEVPSIMQNRFQLLPMNGKAAFDVVAHARELIEPGIAEKVVRFVAAAKITNEPLENLVIEPALLSVVCRELNIRRQEENKLRITEDLLEGNREEILSDFYARSLGGLKPEVQVFLEEHLLTVKGYRNNVDLEIALQFQGFTQKAIDSLIRRRLIRKEERDGSQRLELTHDLLTGVIKASRDCRRNEEKKQEIAVAERTRINRLKRKLAIGLVAGVLISFIGILWSGNKIRLVKRELELREEQLKNDSMNREKKLIELQNKNIVESIKLRQAVLSYNNQAFEEALKNIIKVTDIEFKAKAKYLYRGSTGKQWYRFEMFPYKPSLSDDYDNISLITYIMYKEIFSTPLILTGRDTNFTGFYDGIGCLDEVTVLIEYKDPNRPLAYAQFNMCNIVEGFTKKK